MLSNLKPNKIRIRSAKSLVVTLIFLLTSCASFDKTDIKPGQRVQGFGFSFEVPTETSWFAVVYGTSHRIKLSQLNHDDFYSILISMNHGPHRGMYKSGKDHLRAFKRHINMEPIPKGLVQRSHKEEVDARYGDLCVRQTSLSEDWRGRIMPGPTMVEKVRLTCPHPGFDNVLLSTELSRRYETDAAEINLSTVADQLFSSFEFDDID
jgi:hypothetical protein